MMSHLPSLPRDKLSRAFASSMVRASGAYSAKLSAAHRQRSPVPWPASQTRSSTLTFTADLLQRALRGNMPATVEVPGKLESYGHEKAVLALVTAATIGITALMAPSPAQAWRVVGAGGWGPGLAAWT